MFEYIWQNKNKITNVWTKSVFKDTLKAKKCKLGDISMYQSDCSWKHSFVNENKETDDVRKEVQKLKYEIKELLRKNVCEVDTLAKVHFK